MVEAMFGWLLLIQMTGQTISRVGIRSNNIGDSLHRDLTVALIIDNFTIFRMTHGTVPSPMQGKNLTPGIKAYGPGIGAIVSMTGITGLVG